MKGQLRTDACNAARAKSVHLPYERFFFLMLFKLNKNRPHAEASRENTLRKKPKSALMPRLRAALKMPHKSLSEKPRVRKKKAPIRR
jgi:hypothetical protein